MDYRLDGCQAAQWHTFPWEQHLSGLDERRTLAREGEHQLQGAPIRPVQVGAKLGDRQSCLGKTIDGNTVVNKSWLEVTTRYFWHANSYGM